MLEKAIMKHDERVMNIGLELSEQQMTVLDAEDFEKVKVVSIAKESRKIGFGIEYLNDYYIIWLNIVNVGGYNEKI